MAWHEFERSVGLDSRNVAQARAALFNWQVHRDAGLRVTPGGPITLGQSATLTWVWGVVRVAAPVQVVAITEDGFTYRALPGHPEEGVETFTLRQEADGTVRFTVSARSRPATWWARFGAPLTSLVQRRITDRYLAAARALP